MRADDFGMTLQREPVELAPLLRGVAERVMPFVRARGQDLRVEVAEDLGVFEIDADKIGDAVVNLLTNAIKFTPDGGEIAPRGPARRAATRPRSGSSTGGSGSSRGR